MRTPLALQRPAFLAFLVTLPVLGYVHYRAFKLAFTYDECWSYLGYASSDLWSIVSNSQPAANNHILHSLLMKFVGTFSGMAEYGLRIPSLLAMGIFSVYLFRLSFRLLKRRWWVAYVAVLYQPYLLDYFGMARGYALAMGCTLAAIYYLDFFARSHRSRHAWLALAMGGFAAYSNFTYLLIYIAVLLGILSIAAKERKWKRVIPSGFLTTGLLTLIVWVPLHRLIGAKELYYGGSTGFFSDTLVSLSQRMIYQQEGASPLAWGFVVVFLTTFVWLLVNLGRGTWKHTGFWVTWMLLLTSLGTVLQHHMLGSPYLIDRTAMFILPLLILSLMWVVYSYDFMPWKHGIGRMVVALCLLNVGFNANVSFQLDFKEHADTDQAVAQIASLADESARFYIGKSRYMNATIMFYKRKQEVAQVLPAGLEFCDEKGPTPFYYLFDQDVECVQGKPVELVQHYPISNTFLYRLK